MSLHLFSLLTVQKLFQLSFISTGFEDGINDFTGRGGVETLQIVNTDSYSGTSCLECSNRGKGWHGPWLALEGLLEPGIEYMVSAKAKAQWYNNINLKLDYTDSSGKDTM